MPDVPLWVIYTGVLVGFIVVFFIGVHVVYCLQHKRTFGVWPSFTDHDCPDCNGDTK